MTFVNKEYEYTTREYPYDTGWNARRAGDDAMLNDDWNIVWADTTTSGIFVAYRRPRATK